MTSGICSHNLTSEGGRLIGSGLVKGTQTGRRKGSENDVKKDARRAKDGPKNKAPQNRDTSESETSESDTWEPAVEQVAAGDSSANRESQPDSKPSPVSMGIGLSAVVDERQEGFEAGVNGNFSETKIALATRSDEQNCSTEIVDPAHGFEESAQRRLQSIARAFKLPSMSQAELESNLQEQADEILALESIYGEDFKSINDKDLKSPSFMLSVNVDIPESLILMAELPLASSVPTNNDLEDSIPENEGPSTATDSKTRRIHYFTVQNLPPIQILFTLPPSYPSQSPPHFALHVSWLNSKNLSKYCVSLDALWNDQPGQVVLYQWIDWLQSQALPFLEVPGKLELGPYGLDGTVIRDSEFDLRAVSGCFSFDSDISRLLHYDDERKTENFYKSLHLCNICFTEKPGKEFAKLGCQHLFCWTCMQAHASVHVREGSVNKLICPDSDCKHTIPPFILKDLLDKDAFLRWENLVLQRSLDSMEDIVYCPRCERVCIEEADHFVQCGGCFFSFCSLCRHHWHVGKECVSPEARLAILQGRQKDGSGEEQRKKEQALINEMMNLQYVRKEAKQCPKCKMAISKTEGCNKMTCSNCGSYFCFKCGKSIVGYNHFSDGSCKLFEEQEIARWQPLQIEDQQAQVEFQLALWPELGRPCPSCRQPNIKVGNNNHIFCHACRTSFCSLCSKVVRRTSEHFGMGPSKCRQHTVD